MATVVVVGFEGMRCGSHVRLCRRVLARTALLAPVAQASGQPSRARPDATVATADTAAAAILWLPERAVLERDAARPVTIKNGRSIYVDGTGAVVFSIAVKCGDVAKDISEHFAQTEWRPRSTQYLNPQMATSFNSGCRPHDGGVIPPGSAIPPEPFIEWRGEWENARGDIVTYVVGGTGQQGHGYGAYIPRDVVESGRRKLGR